MMRFECIDWSSPIQFVGPGTRIGDDETGDHALIVFSPEGQTATVIEGDPAQLGSFVDAMRIALVNGPTQ